VQNNDGAQKAQQTYHSPVTGQGSNVHSPRIGLTTYREPAAWGVWNEPADLLPASYADAIDAAGGVALLLPPSASAVESAAHTVLAGLHGLVLTGGADVDPARYDAERDEHTGVARPDRDAWEIALARVAIARQMPVLAICRGMQVLNVALGGDLVQHLPDSVGHEGHCPTPGTHARHDVVLLDSGLIGGILGERTDVATYHHQAVDRLGRGLIATGWAEDGTVEAMELSDADWVAGVQWHPEVHDGQLLFMAFVAQCADHRDRARESVGAP
jgi:putative glutamine amidotransferase